MLSFCTCCSFTNSTTAVSANMAGLFLYEVEAKVNPSVVVSRGIDAIKLGMKQANGAKLHYLFQVGLLSHYW